MKNRDTIVICWELLRAMTRGPQTPTRLSRIGNVPYNRLPEYLGLLTAKGMVKVETSGGHENYSITPSGMELLHHLDSGLKMLFAALE